jgi:hypothetical protein
MKRLLTLMTLTIVATLALAACGADVPGAQNTADGDSQASGTFAGQITIGPICPVEPCDLPEGAAYMGHDLKFIRSGDVFSVPLNADGLFSIALVPADYLIGMDSCHYAGCEVFPLEQTIVAGETVTFNRDFDTGVRSPFNSNGIGHLVADITGLGQAVGMGLFFTPTFFDQQGRMLLIGDEAFQVFPFETAELGREAEASVSPDGTSIGTSMVMWVEAPHFYHYDGGAPESVIVIYPGSDPAVLSLLETVIGPQFAGAAPGVVNTIVAPDVDDPQAQMEAYVAAMIDLRDSLANVGNPDAGDAFERAIAAAEEVASFTPFFQELSDRVMVSLFAFYGERMQSLNAQVADHASRISATITGDSVDKLAAAIGRGPAFALASTETSPLRQVEDGEAQTDGSIGIPMPIMPGEPTSEPDNDGTPIPITDLPDIADAPAPVQEPTDATEAVTQELSQ